MWFDSRFRFLDSGGRNSKSGSLNWRMCRRKRQKDTPWKSMHVSKAVHSRSTPSSSRKKEEAAASHSKQILIVLFWKLILPQSQPHLVGRLHTAAATHGDRLSRGNLQLVRVLVNLARTYIAVSQSSVCPFFPLSRIALL